MYSGEQQVLLQSILRMYLIHRAHKPRYQGKLQQWYATAVSSTWYILIHMLHERDIHIAKKISSDWICIVMKHIRAKCRFPTLKNQGSKMIPVQSKLFPRVLQEPNTWYQVYVT